MADTLIACLRVCGCLQLQIPTNSEVSDRRDPADESDNEQIQLIVIQLQISTNSDRPSPNESDSELS